MIRLSVFLLCALATTPGFAQDLLIANGRVIDGTGNVLPRANVAIHDGRIGAVGGAGGDVPSQVIDASGMTVMPGMIDTHRHLTHLRLRSWFSAGDEGVTDLTEEVDRDVVPVLRGLLMSGFTTVMSPGDLNPEIFDIRSRLAQGEISGPRLLAVGPVFTGPNDPIVGFCGSSQRCRAGFLVETTRPDEARQRVKDLALTAHADGVKAMYERIPDSSETRLRDSVLAAIAAEAATYGLNSMVHAVAPEQMLRSVELGVTRLVHPPYTDLISPEGARRLREAGVAVATTAAGDYAQGPGTEEEVARRHQILLQNIRILWDAGISVAFGTDNAAEFTVEVERLREILTPDEIVMALTGNAATFLGLEDEVGTLQPGRVADVILLDSDPLVDILNLRSVKVVIQGGRIVRDDR